MTDNAEITIFGSIGDDDVTAARIVAELKECAGRPVTVRINSDGGSVTEGVAIFNALRRYSGGVTVVIDYAASIASYIALAGKRVTMAENAYLMIHDPSGTVRGGSSTEMRQMAEIIDKMRATIEAAYVFKSGKSPDEIAEAMKSETWLTAAEAMEWGFIDEITEPLAIAAKFDHSKFKNAPRVDTPAASKSMNTVKNEDPAPETPETDAPDATEHTDPVALDPCPFCANTDLDEGGEQIKCNNCSAMGPVAGSGMDQRGAWNNRAADAADPAPEDAPMDDPGPVAKSKKIEEVRAAFTAEHSKAKRLHSGFRNAAAALAKLKAENSTLAASNGAALTDAVTAKADLAKVTAELEAHKKAEPQRVNAAALRIAQAQGIPPVQAIANTEDNANATKPKPEARGLAKVQAAFRDQIAANSAKN